MCTSVSDEGCGSNGSNVTTQLLPMECTRNNIGKWQQIIRQRNDLKPLADYVEKLADLHESMYQNIACVKMILNNTKQDIIVRMCHTVKTKRIDPCKTMETEPINNGLTMEQCAFCLKDACNGTMFLSCEILYIFLSFLCILLCYS
ncbi:PREDICTED: uncharacterized protein LOC105556223 isoform X2 [Vollenhovia emeryi]|nr:PREDICTED: uncharacterized protein LOC105556223 isoform X2 [Vollenhovia emeryi]